MVGGRGIEVEVDTITAYHGKQSLRMTRLEEGDFGRAMQVVRTDTLSRHQVKYSGYIKTENLITGYAGIWPRIDGPDGVLFFENMQNRGATGTTDWTRYEIETPIHPNAAQIVFGALMPGDGTAWFDDFTFEVVDVSVLGPPSEEAFAYLERALDIIRETPSTGIK